MKKVFLLLLLIPCSLFAQNGSGYSNPQSVTTPAGNTWYVLNRAGDYSNDEIECYNQSQVSFGSSGLVITYNTGTFSCGDYDHKASSHSGNSGMVQTATASFTYGDFQAKILFSNGWPAFWFLGSNCQPSNTVTADNVTYGGKTCNWDVDADDSAEIDTAEIIDPPDQVNQNIYSSDAGSFQGHVDVSNVTENVHVYEMIWTTSGVTWYIDGAKTNGTSPGLSHPLFPMFNIAATGGVTNGMQMTVSWFKHCPTTCANNTSSVDANADFVDTFGSATAPATATGIGAVVH